jgi:hypothetical protein
MTKNNDDETRKRQALRLAAQATAKTRTAEAAEERAIRFARESGASLREIGEAIGRPHMTVKAMSERAGHP